MSNNSFDEIQHDLDSFENRIKQSNTALERSYEALYSSRESLLKLGRQESEIETRSNRKRIDAANKLGDQLIRKEKVIHQERMRLFTLYNQRIVEDWLG